MKFALLAGIASAASIDASNMFALENFAKKDIVAALLANANNRNIMEVSDASNGVTFKQCDDDKVPSKWINQPPSPSQNHLLRDRMLSSIWRDFSPIKSMSKTFTSTSTGTALLSMTRTTKMVPITTLTSP